MLATVSLLNIRFSVTADLHDNDSLGGVGEFL